MPGTISVPPHLIQYVGSAHTSSADASEALEEWIILRRSKGDTLFEISVGLSELEERTPPSSRVAYNLARYATNVPHPSDLTPPVGPFPLSRSTSPVTILHHMLSQPPPSIEHSREVVLEYALAREMKLRDKRPGRGGKGTLGHESFEDIGHRLSEVEEGLRQPNVDLSELAPNRQIGLALILSLRMSLSYFTLPQLAEQLMKLAIVDAERVIVQHIRKRAAGEGRYGVGRELEYLEAETASRPALRPAFRSAKARTTLPTRPYYPIALPAPSKAGCIKLISAFVKDVELGGPPATNTSPKSYFKTGSPVTLPSPTLADRTLPPDPNPIANYVLELVSEYLTREKREYMLKCKWAVKGREALNKDLADIEAATCTSKGAATQSAPQMIPIFLVLRRTFNLPKSPLPSSIVDPYLDILPAPPEPDDVPLREPTISSTTARLYVNPRLDDLAALDVLEELMDNEREAAEAANVGADQSTEWLNGVINQVEKRFPDGSYAEVFAQIRGRIPSEKPKATLPVPARPAVHKQNSLHRRSASTANPAVLADDLQPPPSLERKLSHNRSASLPMHPAEEVDTPRQPSYTPQVETPPAPQPSLPSTPDPGPNPPQRPVLASLETDTQRLSAQYLSPTEMSDQESSGWWDVLSAVDDTRSPWQRSRSRETEVSLPPGAEPARPAEISSPVRESLDALGLEGSSPLLSGPRASPKAIDSPSKSNDFGIRPPPVPLSFDRPNFPSPTGSMSSKSKLGTFGRSLTIASKGMISRGKEKQEEGDKENDKKQRVMNNPGKWNKDLVADIMAGNKK